MAPTQHSRGPGPKPGATECLFKWLNTSNGASSSISTLCRNYTGVPRAALPSCLNSSRYLQPPHPSSLRQDFQLCNKQHHLHPSDFQPLPLAWKLVSFSWDTVAPALITPDRTQMWEVHKKQKEGQATKGKQKALPRHTEIKLERPSSVLKLLNQAGDPAPGKIPAMLNTTS